MSELKITSWKQLTQLTAQLTRNLKGLLKAARSLEENIPGALPQEWMNNANDFLTRFRRWTYKMAQPIYDRLASQFFGPGEEAVAEYWNFQREYLDLVRSYLDHSEQTKIESGSLTGLTRGSRAKELQMIGMGAKNDLQEAQNHIWYAMSKAQEPSFDTGEGGPISDIWNAKNLLNIVLDTLKPGVAGYMNKDLIEFANGALANAISEIQKPRPNVEGVKSFLRGAWNTLDKVLNSQTHTGGMGAMELQFVGDIKAVRVGDKFRATGKLQSRRTGNYIEVSTEIDIPALMAEARSVYNAARAYLAAQGKEIEALPTAEGSIEGMGRKVSLSSAQRRQAQGKSLNSGELALLQQAKKSTASNRSLSQKLKDEKKKQIVQAQMRSAANKRLSERRVERKGYEDKLKELKDQIAASAADATRQAELTAQADQYEARLAQMDEATANMQAQYENQIAQVQAMPAYEVAQLPQAAAISQAVDAQDDAQETMEGMGGWGWLKNIAKKFKKALAVVFRNKIVKGLVKTAATVYGGPAGKAAADAAYGKNAVKSSWKVPGLKITAESARVWIRLIEAAKAGDTNSIKVLNRIKLMARLGHKKATKTFWLLRDIERLLPEVKASLARGDANLTEDPSLSDTEPKAVPDAVLGIQLLGMGAAESQTPVKVRCLDFDPMMGWQQIPFSAAMGKKKKLSPKGIAKMRARQDSMRARQQQARNTPTAVNAAQPGMMQPTPPAGQPFDPYYGQPSGSQAGYPPDYQDPYAQGYDPYAQTSYAPGAAQVDPYAAAYAATPPNYDPYAQTYAAQAQAYGDYSAAQNRPGFDPYNPASYGY